MEIYKFVKDRELKQNHILTYHAGDLEEITSKAEVFGGMSIPGNLLKSIFTFGIKGTRIWSRRKSYKVDSSHIVEGDQLPRMVYIVYKLGKPLHGVGQLKEEPIERQLSMVERLFTKRKKYPRFHHKSVHHQFMFYACVELDATSSYKWPDVFVVGEKDLNLSSLSHDLQNWRCTKNESKIVVKNSNVYLSFQTIPTQMSKEKIMLFAYLNSVRKYECEDCHHEWSLLEYLELLECKKRYSAQLRHGINTIVDNRGFTLQTKYHSCGLWTYYFSSKVFVQKCMNQGNRNNYSAFLQWILNL